MHDLKIPFHDPPTAIKQNYHLASPPLISALKPQELPPPNQPFFQHSPPFSHFPLPPFPPQPHLLNPAPPPRQKAEGERSAEGGEGEPDEGGIGLGLAAAVREVDGGADVAGLVDAGVDDDVRFGVGRGGAGVGAQFGCVGLMRTSQRGLSQRVRIFRLVLFCLVLG